MKTIKGFTNKPIGIPSDIRCTPDDLIITEVWEVGKRFNSISTYCDERNTVSGDGCIRH